MSVTLRTKKKSMIWVGKLAHLSLILYATTSNADRIDLNRYPPTGRQNIANPSGNTDPGRQGFESPGSPFYGDEDDDEDDDEFLSRFPGHSAGGPQGLPNHGTVRTPPLGGGNPPSNYSPPSPSGSPTSKVMSAGGLSRSDGPEPTRNAGGGFSVGCQSPNGVISRGRIEPVRVDDETAEGSKEIVTDFNFPDADILDLAKALGKLTGKNFILDKEVKGRVSIITNSPITVSQAWKLFLTALDVNGFALVPSGAYLRIAKQRDARDKQLKTYTGDFSPDTDALITRVFSLKYISAEEVTRTFRSLMPATSRIIGYEQTNTVIVTDTGSNITRLSKLLEILDVEGFDAGIEVIPVKYASAAELSKLIDALIPGTSAGTGMGGVPGAPGLPRLGGGRFNARRTKEGGIINTIIADERTNTLIVHANSKGADQVRELVAKLDLRAPTSLGGGKVRVVYLQYADAEQVANTLNNFSSQTNRPSAGPPGSSGTGSNPVAASLFEGAIRISPDKATNSLVITASPSDFVTVQRVINQLDIPREQVYVEVVVMEVSISKGFNFSINAAAPGSFLASILSTKDLAPLLGGPLGVLQAPGVLATIPIGNDKVTYNSPTGGPAISNIPSAFAIVRAAQSDSNLNVLSTPQIIALDNTEAIFESTEKVPIPNTTTTANGLANTGFQYQPVTLSIKIKPQINKIINFVKLEVTTKLGEINYAIVPKNLQDTVPGTTERTAQTTVVVGDSDTIVLGGLIRDVMNESVNKVPILGDIPILGWLFKGKTTSMDKRSLLIFMTPHIIRQYDKVRTILDRKLKERDEFLESTTGGVDPLRKKRDEIIRSLPDLKDLTSKHPPTTVIIDEEKPLSPAGATEVPSVPSSSTAQPKNPNSAAESPPQTIAPLEALPAETTPTESAPAAATPAGGQ